MSCLSSLFACCFGTSENEKSEAAARHARIENLYASNSNLPDVNITIPPPSYSEIAHDRRITYSDEKRSAPLDETEVQQLQLQHPPRARRFSVSSRSSVVSVPSTRLSDLTSMYTGATHRSRHGDTDNMSETNGSWTSRRWPAGIDDSAPPSYYAGSTRSVSPIRTPDTPRPSSPPLAAIGYQHPVMQEGWLDGLRFEAERERLPESHASNCHSQR